MSTDSLARGIAMASAAASMALVASRDQMATSPTGAPVFFDGSPWTFLVGDYSAQVAGDPLKGVYNPPQIDRSGRGGTWKRNFYGPLATPWFGATSAGAPNSDAGPLQAAINLSYALRNKNNIGYGSGAGPDVYVPTAGRIRYYCGGTKLTISHTMRLYGDDSGSPSGSGSCLEWNGTCNGIEIETTATGAIVEGLTLKGGFTGTEGEFHAVKRFVVSQVRNCQMYDWPGDAVNDDENVGGGATNGSVIDTIYTENCRCAHKAFGGNANAGRNVSIQSKNNRQAGAYQGGFLGDHYYSGSMNNAARTAWNIGTAAQPASYCWASGHVYACMIGQEPWCAANAPSGTTASNTGWIYWFDQAAADVTTGIPAWAAAMTWRAGGAYLHTGLNNHSTFIGCYAEDTNPSQFDSPAVVIEPFMSYRYLVSQGVLYGTKDAYEGGALTATFAASSAAFPVRLGQTVVQNVSSTSLLDLWNNQPNAAGLYAGIRIQQGLEADGVARLNLAGIRARPTSAVPASVEAVIEFQTRTFGGTGAMTTRFVYDGSNLSLRPDVDNTQDFGLTGFRWRNAYAYTVDATTAFKINGVSVLTGQMAHIANLTAAPTAADFNNLLAALQGVKLMA